MKIVKSSSLKNIDLLTCEAQGISSIELMERAAQAVTFEIMSLFRTSKRIVVIAGPGNNGGDALAVARMLIEQGYKKVEIFLFNVTGQLSHDCEQERKRLIVLDNVDFTEITREFNPPYLGKDDVVIDGLFGSGLNRPMLTGFQMVARMINDSGAFVISIDTPSGLFGEWNREINLRDVVNANLTLTFGMPRLAFFFEENERATGIWKVLDIDLDQDAIKATKSDFTLIDMRGVRPLLRERPLFSGKRDYGSVLVMAGSMGMMGAALMCAKATLRCGAGLVTVHSASCGMPILQTGCPEAMFEPDPNKHYITEMQPHHNHQAIIVGPGIGTSEATINALESLFKNTKKPIVVDADALNCIAARPSLLSLIPPQSVITPHRGEFDRLFGEQSSSETRLIKAIDMAKYYNITIVLKSHYTAIVRPTGTVYFNATGNPGMATAGSGDVLAGVIGSFMAQGYRPELAATIGVFIHGLAGDMAAEEFGQFGMIAGDIIDYLGRAIRKVITSK